MGYFIGAIVGWVVLACYVAIIMGRLFAINPREDDPHQFAHGDSFPVIEGVHAAEDAR